VVKVPLSHAKDLAAIKQKYGLKDEIKLGSNYAILAIDGKAVKAKKSPVQKSEASSVPEMPAYVDKDFKLPDTVGGCVEWCFNKGISATFPDLPTAQEVTKALSEQHPRILQHIQFIGTTDDLKSWAISHPEMNELAKNAKHSMDLTKEDPLGGGAVAIAHPITQKPYTKSVVVVKGSWWHSSKAQMSGSLEAGGFSHCTNLGDVIRHECGHVEAFMMRHLKPAGPEGPQSWEVWKEHCVPMLKKNKKQLMADVSHYGATNPHECWAEVSVMRRTGKKLAGWIQDAIAAMKIDTTDWSTMLPSLEGTP
jgi:hypothetical protein